MKPVLLLLTCLFLSTPAWGNLDKSLDEIEKLIRLRDYPQAVSHLNPLVAKGDPEAQYRLAGLYRLGKGVIRNLDKATDLYHQSAQAGHAEAQYAIALILEKSNKSSASLFEARRWYKKSAEQGNKRASLRLEQLEDFPDIEVREIGRTDIFNAIQHNDEALINSLISNQVDLNLVDRHGNSTVMAALLAGWPRLAGTLIPGSTQLERANSLGNRPIHVAAARGYQGIVIELLINNVDIDQTNAHGDTALMLAAKNKYTEIAELLLELGANHSLVNKKQKTAADLAYASEDSASKALFASYGIKPTITSVAKAKPSLTSVPKTTYDLDTFNLLVKKHGARYTGWSSLSIAIELGETSIANQLLEQKPDPGSTDPEGNSALHVAARKGDFAILKKLVHAGTQVNEVNNRNETALYLAAGSSCLKCVNLLLANNADPSIETQFKATPLEVAIQKNQPKIASALLKSKSSYAGIHRGLQLAVQQKMENLSKVLIARDSQLDSLDDNQRSILWHSVDKGLAKTTALLIDSREIEINQTDVKGHSALTQAVINGHFDIVRMLISAGADVGTLTNEKNSLLMLAVLSRSQAVVEFLLTREIDVNARDSVGDTALMLAASTAQNRMIEMLVNAGADLHLRNNEDLNAFQIATNSGHQYTAKMLHDKSNLVFKLFN
jgi:ankyrin repeat protein